MRVCVRALALNQVTQSVGSNFPPNSLNRRPCLCSSYSVSKWNLISYYKEKHAHTQLTARCASVPVDGEI